MSYSQGANHYKRNSIVTASRGQILLMLYEAAIQHCKRAVIAIEKKDTTAKGLAIGKVHDIVNEFVNSLNHDAGGKIAVDLERLYNFMIEQLVKANLENSKEPVLAVQKLLENLLAGWRGAVEQVNKGTGAK